MNDTCDRTVLIVEDDADLRGAIAEILTDSGYRAEQAGGGQEALDRLAREKRPCIVLLDLMMPEVDGFEVRETMTANEAMRDIPVVVLTAHANRREVAQRLGDTPVLPKPLDIGKLLSTIERHCKHEG
jgi:CheY-like chemotaxis protein